MLVVSVSHNQVQVALILLNLLGQKELKVTRLTLDEVIIELDSSARMPSGNCSSYSRFCNISG